MNGVLDFSSRATTLPIVYGSGDFALEVRRRLGDLDYDCLAVALPPSMGPAVEEGIESLPRISVALQTEPGISPYDMGEQAHPEPDSSYNYVPIDPCQGAIAGLRDAMEKRIDRAYVDLEVDVFEPADPVALADPYALKHVQLEKFIAAMLPVLPTPREESQRWRRVRRMAYELHRLELDYESVVFICSMTEWPWVRQAYFERAPYAQHSTSIDMPVLNRVGEEGSLYFLLGELPYITYLYEHRRAELMEDMTLALDGVKALMLEARDRWSAALEQEGHWLTPHRLGLMLKYVRNRTLMDGRLTPDLYTLALAAKQVVGDDYALHLIETAREYPPQRMPTVPVEASPDLNDVGFDIGELMGRDGADVQVEGKNRLQGLPLVWRNLPLKPSRPPYGRRPWQLQWDPFGQCSYPPEDRRIESFQQHVREQARLLIGDEDRRIEKFTASLKDGLDVRETLRNWHTGDLYVQELPPSRGSVEIVVFLFEPAPVDEVEYSWRGTWYAEHEEESTLCFFATDFAESMVGPGIGQAYYGGCSFLFPPRPIPDIWRDPRLEFATNADERLLAGALAHSQEKRVVLVAPQPPSQRWRRLARHHKRQLAYIPLKRFSPAVVDRLRRFHVLNGKQVRSYASRFIQEMR